MDDVESVQRSMARHAIESGRIPRKDPERVRSGPGLGASCSVCDVPIRQELMEFEVEFTFTRDPHTPPDSCRPQDDAGSCPPDI